MVAAEQWLDVTANNLANVSTNGYKADALVFSDTLQRQLNSGDGSGAIIGTLGSGPSYVGEVTDFSLGNMTATGNPLDVALTGEQGMFAVQTPNGVQYTRDGSFRMDSNGALVTQDGYPVLDNNQNPITIGTQFAPNSLIIGANGDISANGGRAIATLGVYDGTFSKQGGNLWSSTDAQAEAAPDMRQGVVEGSNVNAIDAMVNMIKLNRAMEMAQKSMQSEDDSSQKLNQTMSNS
jgi:flagellar basal body rod protein FlgG